MKKFGPLILSSFLSAIAAVAVYRMIEHDPLRQVQEPFTPVMYTHYEAENTLPVNREGSGSAGGAEHYLTAAPTNFTVSARRATPAVVNIKATEKRWLDVWGTSEFNASSGSGVIVSADGFIVTNNHVIEDGNEYEVTLHDKREYEARLIGVDPSTDLALLKIEADELPFITFGNSDSLQVGEWVLAVGNPFNLESTVTAGIVSAKGRNIDILKGEYSIESFIQTDAAVNPGNSGGALVNTNGDLVGINTAIITHSGRYEGYSFAVPSNLVGKVIRDLRDFGFVQRGILGVGIGELSIRQAEQLGLEKAEGVYITRVTPGSGADEAGIQRGDVIVGINGIGIRSVPELQEIIARYRPGNSLKVEYMREGERYSTHVTLRNEYNSTALHTAQLKDRVLTELGFELRNLTRDEIKRIGLDGIYVTSIYRNSAIEGTQMDPGFIITRVNGQRVNSVEEVVSELYDARGEVTLDGIYEKFEGEYAYVFYK